MKFSPFFAAHLLLLVSVKATDESSVLPTSDTQCSADPDAADDIDHCYTDKKSNHGGGLEETQDDNVSVVVSTGIKATASDSDRKDRSVEQSSSSSSCGAYWAESTIPDAGMGVFTARTISAGETMLNNTGDPVIQIVDVRMQTERRHATRHELINPSGERWLLNDLWLTSFASMGSFEAADVKSFVPGLFSSCNYHPGLVNMKKLPPPINVESPLHRSRDPGAGASTSYHGLQFVALHDIQAGSELFVDYGESFFNVRPHKYEHTPVLRDYELANQILADLNAMTDSDFSSNVATNVWKMITLTRPEDRPIIKALPASLTDVVSLLKGNGLSLDSVDIYLAKIYTTSSGPVAQKAWEILRNLVAQDEPQRVLNALPKKLSDAPRAIELGTAKFSLEGHSDVRSLDWLETNGRCIDNLKPGKSEIPQAGYGAFVTRRMKKGQVVAPVPVAQGHRKQMELYDALNHDDPNSRFFLVGQQLLINYAFGHPDSNLLLFPYSPVVSYINHNSTSYNAELKWSDLSAHRSDWLHKSPSELTSTPLDELGLVLELVATRDIEAGEEVLIDYGSKWESAWKAFVAQWKPPKSSSSYVAAATLNARREWIRTRAELLLRPYPYNVQTICFVSTGTVRPESEGMAGAADWIDIGEVLFLRTTSAFPCQVWERVIRQEFDESYRYNGNQISHLAKDVTIQELLDMDPSESDEKVKYNVKVFGKEFNFFLKGLPRRAIQFFDNQYTSDQFLRNAFRHEMHLPDHLVPAAWKDLKVGE